MLGVKNTTERRHESRYEVASHQLVAVSIQRQQPDRSLRGELLNLSPKGAKVLLPTALRFSEPVDLRIEMASLDIRIELHAQVCWVRPGERNQWIAGCSFAPQLSESVFNRLGTNGIIERRRHPRFPVSIQATARWELDTETVPIEIQDYSQGGFCLSSARPSTIGAAVLVELDALANHPGSSIMGIVCWQALRDERYLIGCMTRNAQAAKLLQKASGESVVEAPRRRLFAAITQ